jgi:hypothetical protein
MVLNALKNHEIKYFDELYVVEDNKKITMRETMQQFQECMHQVKTNNND